MEILTVRNLSFRYPENKSFAVSDVSFSLEKGDFAVICGPTGCGKTTLLRALKPELTPKGDAAGEILFEGKKISEIPSSRIGFVMQKPEQQIVTDKVWHELAFGPESTGMAPDEMSKKIAEISSFFGIGSWYEKSTDELSGGQKQLLNLAAVLVMQPDILILDEPTAMLDPVAAADFIHALKRLNDDFSLTVIMTEHRTEDVIPLCSKLIIMDGGRITDCAPPAEVIGNITDPEKLSGMPAAARIAHALGEREHIPLTVRNGRRFTEQNFRNDKFLPEKKHIIHSDEPALEFCSVYFRYGRNEPDVLKDLNLKIYRGEIFCILGGNGSGKSTALSAASGLLKIYSGKIKIFGREISKYKNQTLWKNCLAMLPQDVQTLFLKNTLREELEACGADISDFPFDLTPLLDSHPYDLSGGQQQIAGLAKILASKPELLILDEPTKGLDAASGKIFSDIIFRLRDKGMTIVTVTHDTEFAAECADRCALLFNGTAAACDFSDRFFSDSTFYTTAVCRMTKGYFKNAVTVGDAVNLCRINGRKEQC